MREGQLNPSRRSSTRSRFARMPAFSEEKTGMGVLHTDKPKSKDLTYKATASAAKTRQRMQAEHAGARLGQHRTRKGAADCEATKTWGLAWVLRGPRQVDKTSNDRIPADGAGAGGAWHTPQNQGQDAQGKLLVCTVLLTEGD